MPDDNKIVKLSDHKYRNRWIFIGVILCFVNLGVALLNGLTGKYFLIPVNLVGVAAAGFIIYNAYRLEKAKETIEKILEHRMKV